LGAKNEDLIGGKDFLGGKNVSFSGRDFGTKLQQGVKRKFHPARQEKKTSSHPSGKAQKQNAPLGGDWPLIERWQRPLN